MRDELVRVLGHRHGWWPVRSRFEVVLGAVLVQNTAWRNAAVSLEELRSAGVVDAASLVAVGPDRLVELVRPSGFPTAKSATLRGLGEWLLGMQGPGPEPDWVRGSSDDAVRRELLALRGVGPETADVLLLYVFDRPAFIADTYSRRLFTRLGWTPPRGYEPLRRAVMEDLSLSLAEWQEFHALIDDYAKIYCRSDPAWQSGPLAGWSST